MRDRRDGDSEGEFDRGAPIRTPRLMMRRPGENDRASDRQTCRQSRHRPEPRRGPGPPRRRRGQILRRRRAEDRHRRRPHRLRRLDRPAGRHRGRHLDRRIPLGSRLRHRGDPGRHRPRLLRDRHLDPVVLQPGEQRPRPARHREMRLPVPRDRHAPLARLLRRGPGRALRARAAELGEPQILGRGIDGKERCRPATTPREIRIETERLLLRPVAGSRSRRDRRRHQRLRRVGDARPRPLPLSPHRRRKLPRRHPRGIRPEHRARHRRRWRRGRRPRADRHKERARVRLLAGETGLGQGLRHRGRPRLPRLSLRRAGPRHRPLGRLLRQPGLAPRPGEARLQNGSARA